MKQKSFMYVVVFLYIYVVRTYKEKKNFIKYFRKKVFHIKFDKISQRPLRIEFDPHLNKISTSFPLITRLDLDSLTGPPLDKI